MANWGGRREGAGRPVGSISKNTAELKELAQEFGPSAIQRLALMAGLLSDDPGASHAVQVAALRELLDRGYGRATQAIAGDVTSAPLAIDFRWADATEPARVIEAHASEAAADDDPVPRWGSSC